MTPRSRLLVTGHSVASQALSGCSSAERYHCGFVVRRALSCPCLFRRHPPCAVFVVLISFSFCTVCRGRLLLGGRGSPDILISDGTLQGKPVIPEDTSTHASAPMDLFDAWSTNCSVLALLLGFNLIVWLLSVHCRVDRSGVRDTAPCSRLPLQPRAECVEFHDAHAGW